MQNQYNQYNLEASFRVYLVAENISPTSLKNYLSDLRHFLGWLQGEQSSLAPTRETVILGSEATPESTQSGSWTSQDDFLHNVTDTVITSYKLYLTRNGVPTKTVNRRLSALRKFFTFAISQGWTKENPAKKINNIASLTNSGKPSTCVGVALERPEQRVDQDLSLHDTLRKYESSLQEKGLRKAQINENITVVRELLQISD